MKFYLWPRKLNRRLSVALFLLLTLLSWIHFGVYHFYARKSAHENEQRLQWDLASHAARHIRPMLEPELKREELGRYFHRMVELNPRLEPYLLDAGGNVLFVLHDVSLEKLPQVGLEAIRKFLTMAPERDIPLYGNNPVDKFNDAVPFSVEGVMIGSEPGYLYIVLHSMVRKSYMQSIEDLHLIQGSIRFTLIGTLIVAGIGTLIFFNISRRFAAITAVVHGIAGGDLTPRVPPSKDRDEIDQLGREINIMADTIKNNVEQLKATDKLRRDLIANISHDIVSPLALTHGQLEQIVNSDEEALRSDGKELAELALRDLQVALKLIRELFELTKLEARDITPQISPFSISEIILQEVIPRLEPLAQQQGIKLIVDCPETSPFVVGDIDLIERAAHNLIENAIKYTLTGGTVTVRLIECPEGIRVEIQDTGIGIPEDQLAFIFERFHRVNPERRRDIPGSGLGLAIVKKALEAQKIDIKVTSEVGVGSVFSFILPIAT